MSGTHRLHSAIVAAVLSIILFVLGCVVDCLASEVTHKRPNILLIVGEDHGCELSCYGDPVIETPNIDRLASQGMLFENGYVTQSVCSPSRSTIFTGLYPHQNGQLGLATHQFGWFEKWPTTYLLLKNAGYRTGLIGKAHVIPAEAVEDYVDFRFQKSSNFSKKNVADYAARAGEFFRTSSAPFFLTVNYPDAHWPLQGQVDGLPETRVDPEKVQVMPYIGGETPRLRQVVQNYYDCMLRLDACVGQLLEQLDASGKTGNTLVVFIGDHGAQMARGKVTVYEAGMRVPFIARWPGVIKPGQRSRVLASTIDLLPTFMDAARGDVPAGLPGQSLRPVFEGAIGEAFREFLVCERNCDAAHITFPQRTVRDARYKLIHSPVRDREDPAARYYRIHGAAHWSGCLTDEELTRASTQTRDGYARWLNPPEFQLFDLKNDPHEWDDLAADPARTETKERLLEALNAWQVATNDPLRHPDKLRMLMEETDAVNVAKRRSRKDGWQYLKYLRSGSSDSRQRPNPPAANAERRRDVLFATSFEGGAAEAFQKKSEGEVVMEATGTASISSRFAHTGKQCLRMHGDKDNTLTLTLPPDLRSLRGISFHAERWTRRDPFSFSVEVKQDGTWRVVAVLDRVVLVGARFLSHIQLTVPGDGETDSIRFRLTAASQAGLLLDDLSLHAAAPEQPTTIPSDVEPTEPLALTKSQPLFVSGTNDTHTFRIPAIATATNGDLIASCDARRTGSADLVHQRTIDIVFRRSEDGGNTWSPIELLDPIETGGCSDPSLLVDEVTGDVFCFYNFMANDKASKEYRFLVQKSSDHGKTWSEPIDFTNQVAGPELKNSFKFVTSGRGIQMRDGTLLHTYVRVGNGLTLFASRDHGMTWEARSDVSRGDESKVVELPNGSLMINSRSLRARRLIHRSGDGGRTWNTREFGLPDPRCNACIIQYTAKRDGYSKDRLIFCNAATNSGRKNLAVRISYDGGSTWSNGKVIDRGPSAYSEITILKDGSFGVLYEPGYKEVRFVRFTLDALTDGVDSLRKPYAPPTALGR